MYIAGIGAERVRTRASRSQRVKNPISGFTAALGLLSHNKRHPIISSPESVSKQSRDIEPMSVYCWAGVVDAGPTFNQHWVDVLRLLCF